MDERTRELIAIGASVATHCQPCLTFHIERARKLGVVDDEIRNAMDIGHKVDMGGVSEMLKHTAELFQTEPNIDLCESN